MMRGLDPYQQKVIDAEGNLLVTACPGSGKTLILSRKASSVLEGDLSSRVCAVTFTRDAAQELEKRIRAQCKSSPKDRLFVGTFHSLVLRQLKSVNINMHPISEAETKLIIKNAFDRTGGKDLEIKNVEDAVRVISLAKSQLYNNFATDSRKAKLLAEYQSVLTRMQVNDFADILLGAVRMMQSGHLSPLDVNLLLVDESQDTDPVQLEWIKLHAKSGCNVMIVGDDDQSIYGWRNSLGYEGMKIFEDDNDASHLSLDINYRCSPHIIHHATKLISRNQKRMEKSVVAHRAGVGTVKVLASVDEEFEAEKIAELIRCNSGVWGVLARTNMALDKIEIMLHSKNIPYKRLGGKNFWEIKMVSIFFSVLNSLIKLENNKGWLTILNWIGVSSNVIDTLIKAVRETKKTSWTGFNLAVSNSKVRQKLSNDMKALTLILDLNKKQIGWQEAFKEDRIRIGLTGVVHWLNSVHPSTNTEQKLRDALLLKMVKTSILSMKHPTLKERLHMIFVKQLMERERNKKSEDRVKLMTVHSSKGLEFENVVILGCSSKKFPLERESELSDIEEERRLFYVGMTRARNNLYMSYSQEKGPSLFLREAGFGV